MASRPERLKTSDAVLRKFCTFRDLLDDDDGVALRSIPGDDRAPLTFRRLRSFIDELDLGRLGLGHASRLCISVPNGPEAAVIFLASCIYTTSAPLNVLLSAAEVAFEFEDLPAAACIVQRGEDNAVVLEECARMGVPAIELVPSLTYVGEFTLEPLITKGSTLPGAIAREAGARSDVALVLHSTRSMCRAAAANAHAR
jgi:hypothetical protein